MSLIDSILNGAIDAYTNLKTSGKIKNLFADFKEELYQICEQSIQDTNSEQIILRVKEAVKFAKAVVKKIVPEIWEDILDQNILNRIDSSQLVCELADDLNEVFFKHFLRTCWKRKSILSRSSKK